MKKKSVSLQKNLEYVRDKMTEIIARLEDEDIAIDRASVIVKAASVMVRSIVAEVMLTEA